MKTPTETKIEREYLEEFLDESGHGCGCGKCLMDVFKKGRQIEREEFKKKIEELKEKINNFEGIWVLEEDNQGDLIIMINKIFEGEGK